MSDTVTRLRAWLGDHPVPVTATVLGLWIAVACLPGLGAALVLTTRPLGPAATWRWLTTGLVHLDTVGLVASVGLWLVLAPALERTWRAAGRATVALVSLVVAGQAAGVLAQLLVDDTHTTLLGGSFLVSAVAGGVLGTAGVDRRPRVAAGVLLVLELAVMRGQLASPGGTDVSHVGHVAAGVVGLVIARAVQVRRTGWGTADRIGSTDRTGGDGDERGDADAP